MRRPIRGAGLINQIHVEGYRSIRDLRLDFAAINVVLGPNGCGKTNLYRALFLIGTDLAAALETIFQIGDGPALAEELERAFPGARLEIDAREGEARFAVQMVMPGIARPLRAAELSDGTLRYLCLLAALLSPRPPKFLALNEPETSLHPDLLVPLAHLVARAARTSQICLTAHAQALADTIAALTGAPPIHLEKVSGETRTARGGND